MRLSIIVPCYNEEASVGRLLKRLHQHCQDDWEVIAVDDGSTDATPSVLKTLCDELGFRVLFRSENGGKTAAVRDGLAVAHGRWVLIQDADLEYDPADIDSLLHTATGGPSPAAGQDDEASEAPVAVYGKRPSCWERPGRWVFASGVLGIDLLFWLVYGRFVRDHATCYKLVPRRLLEQFELESTGFEGCVEITAKLMRSGVPILQRDISYQPRPSDAGKKLTPAYGITAAKAVWHWRGWQPSAGRPPSLQCVPSESRTDVAGSTVAGQTWQ